MKLCLNDFGFFTRNVEDNYIPLEGEAVFDSWPTEDELLAAFPGRPGRIESMRVDLLAAEVRAKRDKLMTSIYDAGTQMIRRELETPPLDQDYEARLIEKRGKFHAYARLLQQVPDQEGFPDVVTWPEPPSAEL